MAPSVPAGRSNQKRRTHAAIVAAARELIATGQPVSMPAIASRALVSEATAYRYFPDLVSLLRDAFVGLWPGPAEALAPVAGSTDPVERVAFATEVLLRHVLRYQGAVRAMIAATVTRPEQVASERPGLRFGLIAAALAPLDQRRSRPNPAARAQLERDLAVVMSAEALFSLIDLCGLRPEDAIASAVQTATTLTRAALTPPSDRPRAS